MSKTVAHISWHNGSHVDPGVRLTAFKHGFLHLPAQCFPTSYFLIHEMDALGEEGAYPIVHCAESSASVQKCMNSTSHVLMERPASMAT
jgi:hypothetical protein